MNPRNTDPWTPEADPFPAAGSFPEQARHLLRYAILAPSGHNTQPWLFDIGDGRIDVYADRRRALPVVDTYDRELVISCGAATGMLETAAARFGFDPTVLTVPEPGNPNLLARVRLDGPDPESAAETPLFEAITERRTTRTAYASTLPAGEVIEACVTASEAHGVGLRVISARDRRSEIAALVAEGDRIQFDDPAFRRELAAWIHSERLGSRDGLSGAGFGMPDILSSVGRLVIRTFDIGNGVAASDERKIVEGTPMLMLLSTAGDRPEDWIATGRALSAVLLTLTAAGFTASYLNQPIETQSLRPKLRDAAGVDGFPQLLLRAGQADDMAPPSVRRDVADVIR